MKILHVIPSLASVRGGPGEAVIELSRMQKDHGIFSEIVTTNDSGPDLLNVTLASRIEYRGASVRFFPRFSPSISSLREYAFSLPLTRWLWQHIVEYTIVHIHALFSYTTTAAMAICRIKNIPYIIRPNGMLCEWSLGQASLRKNIYLTLTERANINASRMIEFTSAQEKKESLQLGFKPEGFICHYGLHTPRPISGARAELRKMLKAKEDTPIVLFISRLHPKKGLDSFIPALGAIKNKNFIFAIAGKGEERYEAKIDRLLSEVGIAGRTRRTGFAEGWEKELLLQGSDIFVLPSYSESFGLAVLEAMASGLPVVITDRVGVHTDVKEYAAGIVTACSGKETTDAVSNLLDNEGLRKAMGENGKKLAGDKFTWEKAAGNIAGVYKRIASKAA